MTSMVRSYNQSNLIKNQPTIQQDQYLSQETVIFLFAICYIVPVILLVLLLFIISCKLPWDKIPSTTTSLLDSKDDNQDAINDVNI